MSLREGLLLARAGEAAHPAAVATFTRLAAAYGTPFYVYDAETIREQARALLSAFGPCFPKLKIRYALKANTNVEIVRLVLSEGLAPEVVSEGEIRAALLAGAKGSEVLFSSSSKSPSEIDFSLQHDVILNVDNLDELGQVSDAAVRLGTTARVSFRINPGVDPDTLHQINTGCSESKFGVHLDGGIAREAYERANALPNVAIAGIHCHIGSQIVATDAYEETARKMFAFVRELKEELDIRLSFVDLGGGLGIPFRDGEATMSPEDLARALKPIWEEEIALLGYEPELCFDTCHVFAAGYPLAPEADYKATMREWNRLIGTGRIEVFHVNDSLRALGSRVDRHEHIGRGQLGLEPFRLLLNDRRFRRIPMILETAKGLHRRAPWDVVNLRTLRGLIAG